MPTLGTIESAIARADAERNANSWALRLERPWDWQAKQPPIERAIEALVSVLAPGGLRTVVPPHTLYESGDGSALLFTFDGYSGNPRDYYSANEGFATVGRELRVDGRLWGDAFTDGGERTIGSSFEVNIDARRPWAEQAALRDALVAAFAPICGFADVTLLKGPMPLLLAVAGAGETELAARYTDEARRLILADRCAQAERGGLAVSLAHLPFIDAEAVLGAIARPSAITEVNLDRTGLVRIPDALARYDKLTRLSLRGNATLAPSEVERARRMLPASCTIVLG
jgi:hypothetical protein